MDVFDLLDMADDIGPAIRARTDAGMTQEEAMEDIVDDIVVLIQADRENA